MKKSLRKTAERSLVMLSIALVFYSCQQEELVESTEVQQSKNFVDLNEATAIATVLEFPIITDLEIANARSSEVASTFKDIEAILEVPDEGGNPAYYIINYKDDGFIMLSADDRLEPIRAYSYDKKFPFEASDLSSGLVSWLSQTSDMVYSARLLNEEQSTSIAKTWDVCEMQANLRIAPIDDDGGCGGDHAPSCQGSYESVGPIMTTIWGQTRGYNDLVEFENCTGGTTPTGCVATAMAQVMNFHEFPSSYNWANMPDDRGTTETAQLMSNIGEAVYMQYSCGSSGAYMNDATSALANDFGFRTVNHSGFSRDKVISEIRSNRPVILSGYNSKKKKCFLWWCSTSYSEGHAWVSDGFRKSVSYSEDCRYKYVYYYLHMNWGWDGSQNAFYRWNDWSPGNFNFQYKKEMITLRP